MNENSLKYWRTQYEESNAMQKFHITFKEYVVMALLAKIAWNTDKKPKAKEPQEQPYKANNVEKMNIF